MELENRPREFVALESKLNLLGQQYSGARRDNTNLKRSLDDKVASMASQFDVASRLAAAENEIGPLKSELAASLLRFQTLQQELQSGAPKLRIRSAAKMEGNAISASNLSGRELLSELTARIRRRLFS